MYNFRIWQYHCFAWPASVCRSAYICLELSASFFEYFRFLFSLLNHSPATSSAISATKSIIKSVIFFTPLLLKSVLYSQLESVFKIFTMHNLFSVLFCVNNLYFHAFYVFILKNFPVQQDGMHMLKFVFLQSFPLPKHKNS